MPTQTTKKTNIYFPDGALVSIKESGGSTFFDLGAINSAVTATLNWDENQVDTANAGKLAKQIRNMTIAGGLTLINLDSEGIEKLGAGVFTRVVTAGTPDTGVVDHVIASGACTENVPYNMVMINASDTSLKANASPTLTSVTGATDGALTVNDDYFIVADSNSPSGYSIMFNVTTGTNLTTLAQVITVVYTSVTPIASTKITAGASTQILSAFAMKITHTDDNGKIRELELFAVDSDSGGFQFNYQGANEDGVEKMPLAFTAKLDTTLTSGQQLMSWTVEDGAQ